MTIPIHIWLKNGDEIQMDHRAETLKELELELKEGKFAKNYDEESNTLTFYPFSQVVKMEVDLDKINPNANK